MKFNITSKEVYNILKSDDEIFNIYKNIETKEKRGGGWAFHNVEHVNNVSQIAEKILIDLNFDEEVLYNCKIACLLHDVGALEGKDEHAERSFQYASKLFFDKGWIFKDSNVVLDAIKNHSSGFESNDILTLAIILADKLDVKKSRISEEGKKIEGNRQYAHIEDIIIDINNNKLTINFVTDNMINMQEVNNYYFTLKIFKAIDSFSKKLDLQYDILIDNKIWNIK